MLFEARGARANRARKFLALSCQLFGRNQSDRTNRVGMLELDCNISSLLLDTRIGIDEGGDRRRDSAPVARLSVATISVEAVVSFSVMIDFCCQH